ncbi:MAG: hypothetical protein EOO28_11805 [Comamonadaceae bacterium]|nr:MAG: hypothetical protein EOO28_11805 [Comamonadaceae bacterium]
MTTPATGALRRASSASVSIHVDEVPDDSAPLTHGHLPAGDIAETPPLVRGQSNLAIAPQNVGDAHPALFELLRAAGHQTVTVHTHATPRPDEEIKRESDGHAADASHLPIAQAPLLSSEETGALLAFIDQLAALTPAQASHVDGLTAPDASAGLQRLGATCAGASAYLSSFLFANGIEKLLAAQGLAAAGRIAFPIVGGTFNALFSEALAGAIRNLYGSHGSPDAGAATNYSSASAQRLVEHCLGDAESQARWNGHIERIVDAALDRQAANAAAGHPLPFASGDHPVLAAALRSCLSNQVPFLAFSVMYLVSGGVAPLVTAGLGGPDNWDKAANFAVSAACGTLAGSMTVLGQNTLRRVVEHAPTPKEGGHSQRARVPEIHRLQTAIVHLEDNRLALENHRAAIELLSTNAPGNVAAATALERIDDAMSRNAALQANHEQSIATLQMEDGERAGVHGRNLQSAWKNLGRNTGLADGNAPAWLDGWPAARRTMAKALGNTAALGLYVMHMELLASAMKTSLPQDHLATGINGTNPYFDSPQAQAEFIQQGISEVLLPSMTAGMSLIGAWWTRDLLTPMMEHGLALVEVAVRGAGRAVSGLAGFPHLQAVPGAQVALPATMPMPTLVAGDPPGSDRSGEDSSLLAELRAQFDIFPENTPPIPQPPPEPSLGSGPHFDSPADSDGDYEYSQSGSHPETPFHETYNESPTFTGTSRKT